MRFVLALALVLAAAPAFAAEHSGTVTFNGAAVPGASVTATRGDQRQSTVTDVDGVYRFADLADGEWAIDVEMFGFAPATGTVTAGIEASAREWPLRLRTYDEIRSGASLIIDRATPGASPAPAPVSERQAAPPPRAAAPAAPAQTQPAEPTGDAQAADGFLINGSVNNSAASPFAQLPAFGNNRRGQRSLYNGGLGVVFGTSAWDARPFSFTARPAPKPSYDDLQVLGTFSGPVRLPGLRNRMTLYFGYQRSLDHNTTTGSALVPTRLERGGDFSQSLDASGQPVAIVDPLNGQPFPQNRIPADRISSQATSLLAYYPQANANGGGFNYQTPLLTNVQQDNLQLRANQTLTNRDALFGNFLYQRTATDATSLFAFTDAARASATDAAINWSRRFSPFLSMRLRYQYLTQHDALTPYFAGVTNVSGEAGIQGNDQTPANWGPPALQFSSGLAGLADGQFARNADRTDTWSAEFLRSVGRHGLTFGGGFSRQAFEVNSQANARGGFSFTGALTGSALADFLVGLPSTSNIAFGNADKRLSGRAANLYLSDDWRVSPALTVSAGVRWEYESPLTEEGSRLANLDLADDFSGASIVTPEDPDGATTGAGFSQALIGADWRGLQPRLGVAWRPVPGSSLVIRGGYGVYRNTNVYKTLALLLAQQPPFSKAFTVPTSADAPLTLATGFNTTSGSGWPTFAIDPAFRVGYAHNWQVSAQRDLRASLTVIGTYFGTSGQHLMQEFLPNTYPTGAVNPCPTCPSGFIYLASNGSSHRDAGQVQLRRRLRNGLTATAQYTLAKATDNASAFVPSGAGNSNAGIGGATIAQDWRDLDAEHGRSVFDQRHQFTAQVEYTTGMGVSGGALLDGLRGTLFKGWTVTARFTAGSGLPLTPIYLTPASGSGVTGTIRGSLTGASTDAPDGYFLNPAAYTSPAGGAWGTAGRHSISGPAQYSVNAGLGRTFTLGERMNLDWRLDATNLLNQVNYSGVNTFVGSPQFGLPNRAATMRKIQTTARLRF